MCVCESGFVPRFCGCPASFVPFVLELLAQERTACFEGYNFVWFYLCVNDPLCGFWAICWFCLIIRAVGLYVVNRFHKVAGYSEKETEI